MKKSVPYGEWESPILVESAAKASGGLVNVAFSGRGIRGSASRPDDRKIFWAEAIPGENRTALFFSRVKPRGGSDKPEEFAPGSVISARSRINEYGGGAFWLYGDPLEEGTSGRMWWVAADTQVIWTKKSGAPARELTPRPRVVRALRYSAGVTTRDGNWSIVEMETHALADLPLGEAVNEIVAVSSTPGAPVPLVCEGVDGWGDFVAGPRLSPDGATLAWLRWDHPDMPWDSAELWAASLDFEAGVPRLSNPRRVAGGIEGGRARGLDRPVSVCLPEFSPDGRLWWCDDSNEFWHLHRANSIGLPAEGSGDLAEPLLPDALEEVGEPRWNSGGCRYGFVDEFTIVFAAISGGLDSVWVYDITTGSRSPLPGPQFTYLQSLAVDGTDVALIAGGADIATSVFHVDLVDGSVRDLRSAELPVAKPWVSTPETIDVTAEDGSQCHALFYPPVSGEFTGPEGDLPPLLVRIHGGPTASARAEFSTSVQFWTTRGFAVAEVNYRGSTGYGRTYRDLLRGQWGVSDVRDCIAVARYLAERGLVDADRCVIRGGSAGGFTALAALCFQHQWGFGATFAAACSLYGVTDLAALARDTHKFESRYLDGLVGEYPAEAQTYADRSPLSHADQLQEPVLVLQGSEDKIVPPSQAEVLVNALAERGIPHGYILFQGEGHGFQSRSTIARALEAELGFYGEVLGFEPVGGIAVLDRSE